MKRLFIVYGLLLTISTTVGFAKEAIVDLKKDTTTVTQAIATVQDTRAIRLPDIKKQVKDITKQLTDRAADKQKITKNYNNQIVEFDKQTLVIQKRLADITALQTDLVNLGVQESIPVVVGTAEEIVP